MIRDEHHNKTFGNNAERIVAKQYEKRGWVHLQDNFRTRNSELDLIFMDNAGETLLFVEVKALEIGSGLNYLNLTPEDNFTKSKQKMFRRGIEQYLALSKNSNKNIRIDLACIIHDVDKLGKAGEWRLKLYENVILD
jgi:Holliday junction resolvase-like predicted endonuclease